MHQYDLVSRTGDDRPAFLLSARGRGPPATRKWPTHQQKLLNLQEEYFMKKFIKKITHTAKSAVTCVKTAAVNSMSAVLAFNRRAVCSNAGEGYIDTAVKVLIAVVLGALVLAGLYAILNDTVMPTVTQKITEMFSYNG
jgi:hypothetical protein